MSKELLSKIRDAWRIAAKANTNIELTLGELGFLYQQIDVLSIERDKLVSEVTELRSKLEIAREALEAHMEESHYGMCFNAEWIVEALAKINGDTTNKVNGE